MEEKREIIYSDLSSASRKQPYDVRVCIKDDNIIAIDTDGKIVAKGVAGEDDKAFLNTTFSSFSGKVIFLDEGTYTVNSTVFVPAGTAVIGKRCMSTIRASDQFSAPATGFVLYLYGGSVMDGVQIDGNKDVVNPNGVHVIGERTRLENCFIHDVRPYSVTIYNSLHPSVVGNWIGNSRQYGVATSHTTGAIISGNHIFNCDEIGIALKDSTATVVSGNSISVSAVSAGTGAEGIRIRSDGGDEGRIAATITGNTIVCTGGYSVGSSGVRCVANEGSEGNIISSNTIKGFKYGIQLSMGSQDVTGNAISRCRYGIYATQRSATTDQISISQNRFESCDTGIDLENVFNYSISGNNILNCGTPESDEYFKGHGIRILGGSHDLNIFGNTISNTGHNAIKFHSTSETDPLQMPRDIHIYNNYFRDIGDSIFGTHWSSYKYYEHNVIVRGNIGYVTENSGEATITGSSGTIAHGCARTPTKVILTSKDVNRVVAVTNIGATDITVAIRDLDGETLDETDTTAVYWRAEV